MSEAREGLMFKSFSSNPLFKSRSWKIFTFSWKYFTYGRLLFPLHRTPLHCAAANNATEMARFLTEHGACIFAATSLEKKTPMQCCERGVPDYFSCMKYLNGESFSYFGTFIIIIIIIIFFLFVASLFVFGRNALIIRIMEKSWVLVVEIVIRVSQRA